MDRQRRTAPPELGAMLGAARLRRGLRIREAARLADIDHAYLIRLETAQRVPSRSVAEALAEVLGLDGPERVQLFAVALPDIGRDAPGRRLRGSKFGSRRGVHGHHS